MRPSRQILRVLCALTFAGGAALLALGLRIALTAQLQASAEALASIGGFVIVLSLLGFIGAGREKSGMLMLYFFINFGLVTCLFVSSYAAVAFQNSLESWLKLHWNHPTLDYIRTKACCTQYTTAVHYLEQQFTLLGTIGFACLALVLASMYCVIRIVTVPIVMKNLLNVINVVFLLLGGGILAYGCMVHTKDELTSGQDWIAMVFIVAGTMLFAQSIVGIIGSRSKSRTMLLIYIVGIGACLVALVVCAGAAFSFSNKLAKDYSSSQHATQLACEVDLPGCTNCSDIPHKIRPCTGVIKNQHDGFWYACNTTTVDCQQGWTLLNTPEDQGYVKNDIAECGKCPEWTKKDVQGYLESGLQLLGLFAAIVCFFIIVGFAAAVILRKSLAGYQTDSI